MSSWLEEAAKEGHEPEMQPQEITDGKRNEDSQDSCRDISAEPKR